MKGSFKIIWTSFRYCVIRLLEYKSETFIWSVYSLLWALIAFATVSLIFGQVDSIAGWTKNEALVISLICTIFNGVLWWFVYPSILYFIETVRTGQFDFYLTKPVNPRLLISFSRFSFGSYIRVLVTLAILIWLINSQSLPVNTISSIYAITLFILGAFIFYCLFFILATLSIWLINLSELEDLFDTMVTSGRYPSDIFKGSLRIFFFYVIPLAFIATFPAQVLLQKGGLELVILGLVVALSFFLFSQWFWAFALRHYSSASS